MMFGLATNHTSGSVDMSTAITVYLGIETPEELF